MEVAVHASKILEGEGVKFVFVGDGSDKPRIVALAKELKANDTLFLDPIPPCDVAKLYTLATAGRGPQLTVTGEPGELLLFAAGRDEARVEFDGPADLVERVKASRGGL